MQAVLDDWTGLEELRGELRGFLARRCNDENELEDVIQETYLRAVRYRESSEVRRLRSWTFSIARNVLRDRRRRQERFQSLACDERAGEPELVAEEPDDEPLFHLGRWTLDRETAARHLGEAFAGLRAEDQRVLDSFYRGGECSRATARDCAIPQHLVKIRLFRARKRLLRALRRRLALAEGEPC